MKHSGIRGLAIALGLLFLIVLSGIFGFMVIEGYSFINALYMTIITIATVGFREVHPLSDAGKIFTIFLIITSFGIFAYTISSLTRFIIDGVFRHYFKDNKVKRKIENLSGHVIVCGYGRNGKQAVAELIDHGESVVIIEKDPSIIQKIRESSDLLYVEGDSTNDEVLGQAGLERARALITAQPNDADNLFVVLTAKEVNPGMTIISRASDEHSIKKLVRAGAKNVVMSDKIGGQRLAKLVAQPDVVEFLDHIMLQRSIEVKLEEVTCRQIAHCFLNKSIRELDIRNASGANIVGLRRNDGSYIINPPADVILTAQDKLFVLGTPQQVIKLKEIITGNNN
jgi:voltage-gated potassium channel